MTQTVTQTVLYDRKANPDYIPRVAAVHDLCGYGKCSLGIAIPVVSAGGCDVSRSYWIVFRLTLLSQVGICTTLPIFCPTI